MDWLRQLRFRALGLLRRKSLEAEMAEELQQHIERQQALNIQAGMSAADARYDALRQFGHVDAIKESCRDQYRLQWTENLLQDIQYGVRQLLRNPGFSVVTTLTLALGIGAFISVFTASDNLLFRPLPFRAPDRLVRLWETNATRREALRSLVSADNFLDWKTRNTVFEEMAAYYDGRSVLFEGDRSEELHIQGVTTNFFSMLGVQPAAGHLFAPGADAEEDPGLIISYRLWQNRFGADPGVIGRTVHLDAISGVIVGVTPPGFSFGDRDVDLWLPLELTPSFPKGQGRNLNAIARLKPGVGFTEAQSQMASVAQSLEEEDPPFNQNWSVSLEPLRESFTQNIRTSLLILLGAAGLLLITACVNAANLLVARSLSRRAEMAVRAALGASRGRLVQQLLTESLILTVISGIVGLGLGQWMLAGMVELAPRSLTQTADISIDSRVMLFAVSVSVVTGLLFGLVPAWFSTKTDVAPELKQTGRSSSWRGGNIRSWLIAGEVAISVMLLTGGSLLVRSLVKLQAVDPGLHANNVLTFHCRVPSPENITLFALSIERIAALPGVRSASATSFLPFDGPAATTRVQIGTHPPARAGEELLATVRTVMPRYFETIGIPMVHGRDFVPDDNTPGSPLRFVVNEAFAQRYLIGEEPLGTMINTSMARTSPYGEIIGVVGNVKEGSLKQRAVPTVYYAHGHMPYGQMNLVVRSERDPMALLPALRNIIHELDPTVPISDAQTMTTILAETYGREKFSAVLMGSFSLIALLLAAIGIYGLLSYSVSERMREIGIRLAVGASRPRIVSLILNDAARLVVPGLAIGLAGAFAVSSLLSSLLFDTGAKDPLSFLVAPRILLLVAVFAAYLPARRAASLDPMIALRLE